MDEALPTAGVAGATPGRPHRSGRHTAPTQRASVLGQMLAGLVGLGSAALAIWLALHHPLSPLLALGGALLLAAAQAAWPPLWLVALPALLPWIGFGAWSGWMVAEEMDIAVLAVAAGAYGRWALRPGPRLRASRDSRSVRRWGWLLLALWTVSVLASMHRGAVDAGGWSLGWWQGLREPLNALRLTKPTLAALLLLPLWWRLQQRPGQRCADQLTLGMTLMLAGVAAWCLWERLAFTGLLDMTTDYRTTGPFWETGFGGAALDISLALGLPFALRLALTARQPVVVAAAGLAVLAGVYAGLTSFSRILYLALPVGALVVWVLLRQQQRHLDREAAAPTAAPNGLGALALLAATVAVAGLGMFGTSGYRGLLALLGNAVLLLWLAPRSLGRTPLGWTGACVAGLVLAAALAGLLMVLTPVLPKAPYLAYGAITLALAGLLLARRGGGLAGAGSGPLWPAAAAGFIVQLACTVLVAVHWGGAKAAPAAIGAVLLLAGAWVLAGTRRTAPWSDSPAALVRGAIVLGTLLALLAVFGGGSYMRDRLQRSEADRAGRWEHFRDGLALNDHGAALWLGRGLGRYPELYALNNRVETRPGDIRLVEGDGGPAMRMVAGRHTLGYGELLRLSQRVAGAPDTGLRATLQVRTDVPAKLYVQLCHKHLLYDIDCRTRSVELKPAPGTWQALSMDLPDAPPSAQGRLNGFTVLSVASETRHPVDLRGVSLTDRSGREWLANPDFRAGGARWFMTSDRNHLPWHAKNMGVHLVVEQGLLGLAAMLTLGIGALAALVGPMRRHPLAPALTAALVGTWVVGSVDSVLDMPRVATWLLLLTAMALQLHQPSRATQGGGGANGRDG